MEVFPTMKRQSYFYLGGICNSVGTVLPCIWVCCD